MVVELYGNSSAVIDMVLIKTAWLTFRVVLIVERRDFAVWI